MSSVTDGSISPYKKTCRIKAFENIKLNVVMQVFFSFKLFFKVPAKTLK